MDEGYEGMVMGWAVERVLSFIAGFRQASGWHVDSFIPILGVRTIP
jgi:hypothetical protein